MNDTVIVEFIELTNEQMDKLKRLNGIDPDDKDEDNILWGILAYPIKGKGWLVGEDSSLKYGLKYVL